MSTVISSGTVYVNNGDKLNSPDILNTGIVYVNSGGLVDLATVHDGGEEYVLSNGWDYDAIISSGGVQHINTGRSYRAQVFNGGIISGIGATISSAVVNNGGSMALSGYVHQTSGLVSRGYVMDTTINSGGVVTLQKYAACSNTTINGGKLLAYSGTEVYGVNMTDGYILIDSAYAFSVTMSGGSMLIRGSDSNASGIVQTLNMNGGVAWIEEGGIVSNGKLNKGTLRVQSGGLLESGTAGSDLALFVEKGGTQNRGTVYGEETIAEGGTAVNVTFTPLATNHIYISGNAHNCCLEHGSALIASSGFFRGDIITMDNTGIAELIALSGGRAIVDRASASRDDARIHAILSGGVMEVFAGKVDWVYLKDTGGIFTLNSRASIGSANISNGLMNVYGVLRNPGVSSGGSVRLFYGGVITGKFEIANGALVTATSGGIVDFDLSCTSAGAAAMLSSLSLIKGTPDYSLTVDANQSVGSYKLAGGAAGFSKTLTVKDSAGTELGTLAVDGDVVGYSGKVYGLKLTDDTLSVLVANGSSENVFMGTVTSGTKEITSGMTALGATVKDSGVLNIQPDGNASNTTILDGGKLYATDASHLKGLTINQGGAAYIGSDTMAGNVVVNGGELHIESDGWAYQTSKGKFVSSNTVVKNGGTVIVSGGGFCSGVIVSDGHVIVESGGDFGAATVTSGDVTVKAGVERAGATLLDGGVMVVESGGTGGCIVSSGGIVKVESGGYLSGLTVSAGGVVTGVLHDIYTIFRMYGGTLDLDISNAAPGGEFLMDDDANFDPNEDFNCTLTVNGSQANGTYNLMEYAYDFDTKVLTAESPLTVKNTSGEALGTLTVGETATIGGVDYTLNLSNDYHLTVTIKDNPTPPTPGGTVAKSDIDGNGVSDVMFVWTGEHGEGNYQHGYWMNGTSEWQSANSSHPAEWENLGCYDMTGDGKADSVLVGNVVVNEVKGAYIGYYADSNDLPDGSTWVNIGYLNNADDIAWKNKVGNLTGGSANSIVWYAPELYALGVWKDGKEDWSTLSNSFGGSEWTLVGCGDFDGDGKDSVVMSYAGQVYYTVGIDGTTSELATSDSGWEVRAIGDFSGNGKDDIIVFHKETGLVAMWGNGSSSNWTERGQLDAQDWFVVGAGDYNGDQQDDLLVRQYSTGMLGYYSAGNMNLWTELGRGVDMQWTVIA